MAKRLNKKVSTEKDSVYFLKIVLFFILGSIWVRFDGFQPLPGMHSLPLGLLLGLLFAAHEHFQIDRKIEYAILLGAAIISYVVPLGVVFAF